MSDTCSTCGHQNPNKSAYCLRCGSKMEITQGYQQSFSSTPPMSSAGVGNTGNLGSVGNTGNLGSAGSSSFSTLGYQAQNAQAQVMASFSSAPEQMGSSSGITLGQTAPHAFAGRGTLLHHYMWLLPGEHLNATNLRSAILDLLRLRDFRYLKIKTEKLRESGYWTEERDYITLQRGAATVFVYVAPAGRDLYISRATTIQLSFDPIRIILLLCIVGEVFFGPSIMGSLMAGSLSSAAGGIAPGLGLVVPLLILILVILFLYIPSISFLITFLVASVKYWMAERDFWVYLRRNVLHDFEIDDIKLLEHATDETIYAAGEQLKVDVTKMTPPTQGDQARRRVRAI